MQRRSKMSDNKYDVEDQTDATPLVGGGLSKTPSTSPAVSVSSIAMATLSACLMGFTFGFALEKGRVFEPGVIVAQMRFHQELMLKMFLSAVASSLVFLSVLSWIPATRPRFEYARDVFGYTRGWPIVALGAFVLGCGMTVAGACPGTVLAQIGAGIDNALIVYGGGLVAVFVYGAIEQKVFAPLWEVGHLSRDKDSVDKIFGVRYGVVAPVFAAVLIGALVALEHFFPWKSDYEFPMSNPTSGSIFTRFAWPPIAAGAIIGLNQLPAVMLVGDTIGSASSYATIVSNAVYLVAPKWASTVPHFANARWGIANWWQVVYVCCAVLGALSSSTLSGTHGIAQGVSAARSFIGGFLILFGSRIAAGCTSGHGISGMGLMVLVSFVAIPAMFAGGILMALWPAM